MEKEDNNKIIKLLNNLPPNIFIGRTWLFTEKCRDTWIMIDSKGWMLKKANTLKELLIKLNK